MQSRRETIEDLRRRLQARIRRFEPRDGGGRCERRDDRRRRSHDEREESGIIPGSIHIPRSVLEWRLDPDATHCNPAVADLERELILVCADGYSSSFAVESLERLGFARVGDLVGRLQRMGRGRAPDAARAAAARRPAGNGPGRRRTSFVTRGSPCSPGRSMA